MNIELNDLLDNLFVGIFLLDEHMQIKYWSKSMLHYSGKYAEEVIDENFFNIFSYLKNRYKTKLSGLLRTQNQLGTAKDSVQFFKSKSNKNCQVTKLLVLDEIKSAFKDFEYKKHTEKDWSKQNCEFRVVNINNQKYILGLVSDITQVINQVLDVEQVVLNLIESNNLDGLTSVYNRKYLEQQLAEQFNLYERYQNIFSIMMFDIDFFKKINDNHGHLAGDYVLKVVCQVVKKQLRTTDHMGRYGGEEFVIIFPHTELEEASIIAERIRLALYEHSFHFDKKDIPVAISGAVNQVRDSFESYIELIKETDEGLYLAKQSGRNQIIVCDNSYISEGV